MAQDDRWMLLVLLVGSKKWHAVIGSNKVYCYAVAKCLGNLWQQSGHL
jgi:hypothetical protein